MKTAKLLFAGVAILSLTIGISATAFALPQYAYAPQSPAYVKAYQHSQYGWVLTDEKGWILYSYAKDTPGVSTCYDVCAQVWVPYLVPEGVYPQADWKDNFVLGSIKRNDGYWQATYNNIPLYYYLQDQKAGDAYGNGYGGVWSIIKVDYHPPQNNPSYNQNYSQNNYGKDSYNKGY